MLCYITGVMVVLCYWFMSSGIISVAVVSYHVISLTPCCVTVLLCSDTGFFVICVCGIPSLASCRVLFCCWCHVALLAYVMFYHCCHIVCQASVVFWRWCHVLSCCVMSAGIPVRNHSLHSTLKSAISRTCWSHWSSMSRATS